MTALGVFVFLAAASVPAPLGPRQLEIFFGTPEDTLDKAVCVGELRVTQKCRDELSYVISNEGARHVFEPHIRNLGGAYLGVGGEQGYTFIAWARPELVWLLDYDPTIVMMHQVHEAFISRAATPDEFRALWRPSTADRRLKRPCEGMTKESTRRLRSC